MVWIRGFDPRSGGSIPSPVARKHYEREFRMDKKAYTTQEAKMAFMQSMYGYLQRTFAEHNVPNFLTIEGSSIFVNLPSDFFTQYTVPENTRFEMKFIAKKA